MSTRSYIAIKEGKKYTSIYCHFDGYLEYVWYILLTHYSNSEKLKELLQLWDISILWKEIWEKQNFDDFNSHNEDWCLVNWRDRGETETEAHSHNSLTEFRDYFKTSWCAYVYIYDVKNKKWFYFTSLDSKLRKLTFEAIREKS